MSEAVILEKLRNTVVDVQQVLAKQNRELKEMDEKEKIEVEKSLTKARKEIKDLIKNLPE